MWAQYRMLAPIILVLCSKHKSLSAVEGNSRCSVVHTEHINALCEHNVELLNVTVGVT